MAAAWGTYGTNVYCSEFGKKTGARLSGSSGTWKAARIARGSSLLSGWAGMSSRRSVAIRWMLAGRGAPVRPGRGIRSSRPSLTA